MILIPLATSYISMKINEIRKHDKNLIMYMTSYTYQSSCFFVCRDLYDIRMKSNSWIYKI